MHYGDIVLLKFNTSGALIWNQTWGSSAYEVGIEAVVDTNYDVCVVGWTGVQGDDVLLVKFDALGNLKGYIIWGRSDQDIGWGISCDAANNLYVVGRTASFSESFNDAFLVKKSQNTTRL